MKTFKYKPLAAIIMASLVLPVSAFADAPADNDVMVVTASGYQKKLTDSPASVSIVSQKDLQQKNYMNLGEALSGIEGVDVRGSTGKTGNLEVSIRGMSSDKTLVLIDGIRQSPSSDLTPNGFSSMNSAMMPPMSAIDHIEVIRGPMSTLYGSDAMGGVVNIITKKNTDKWHGSVNLGHSIQEHDKWGDTSNLSFYSAGPLIKDKLNLAVRGQTKHRQGSSITTLNDSSNGTRSPFPTESDNYSIGGKLSYNVNDDHTIWIDSHVSRQNYDNDKNQLGPIGTGGGGYKDEVKYEEEQVIIGHDSQLPFGQWSSDLSYMVTEAKGRVISDAIAEEIENEGNAQADAVRGQSRELKNTNVILNTKLVSNIGSHVLTTGGQYWDARMKDGVVLANGGDKFKQKSYALFAEDDWQLLQSLDLTVGGRYEHHDAFGGHFSPRAYLVWDATDNWTFKGGVSTGYQAPSLAHLYNGVSGITRNGRTIVHGNPNLDPEESTNYELGAYYQNNSGFNANVTVFLNRYKNALSTRNIDDNNQTYTNIGKARMRGVEFATSFPVFTRDLNLSMNYTYTQTKQIGGDDNGQPFRHVPKHMANAKLDWQVTDNFNSWLQAEYHGKTARYTSSSLTSTQRQIKDGEGELHAWTVLNLGASYRITDAITVNGRVNNLLDKDFSHYSTYGSGRGTEYAGKYFDTSKSTSGTAMAGRNVYVSMNYQF